MSTTTPTETSPRSQLSVLQASSWNESYRALQSHDASYNTGLKSCTSRQAEAVILSLAGRIEARDPLTEGHSQRLAEYSILFGEKIGLRGYELAALRVGSLVHDIGKIAVPDAILFKPGPLTFAERTIIEQHPIVGENICALVNSLRDALPIVRHHHERMNGSGYPDGLSGEEIPLSARILQIVDIYDALTSNRPYRKALSPEEALDELSKEAERGWLDGSLVIQFNYFIHGSLQCLSRDRSMLIDYFN